MPTPTEALTPVASPRAAGGTPADAPTLTPTTPAATATRPSAAVATAVPPAPPSTYPSATETTAPAATATGVPSPQPTVAPSGQVSVLTDKRTYGMGVAVTVTIVNGLSVPVYGQTGQSYCSIVAILRDVDGQWPQYAGCAEPGQTTLIEIPAKGQTKGPVGTGADERGVTGPLVSEPVTPFVRDGDLTPLPTQKPWKPGDPIPVIPEGEPLFDMEAFPLNPSDSPLVPGRYRIAFSFWVGSATGPQHTVYSEPFDVVP